MRFNASPKRANSPASAEQCLVCRIDDCIDLQRRDIGFNDFDRFGHERKQSGCDAVSIGAWTRKIPRAKTRG
jgi:hypothetical protein